MNALDYVKQIRLAPNGELLAASEKLALILLAMGEGEEDGATCPSIDELAEHCLLSRRSMFRVLSQLEIKGAIRSLLRYNSKGQQVPTFYYLLDSKGRVLPVTPSLSQMTPSLMFVTPAGRVVYGKRRERPRVAWVLLPPPPLSILLRRI